MISDLALSEQLKHVLTGTNFNFLGKKYQGKVRDNYVVGNTRYLITTDRLSAFDVVLTSIPFKGQVLTQMATEWFQACTDIVRNHIIDLPDPNVIVAQNCEIIPVEVVVRAYLAGSAWRDYQAGNDVSGVRLPPGLRESDKLPETILTPSTKAAIGTHDVPISEEEILKQNIVGSKIWAEIREVAFALFRRGQDKAANQGLILVDTKYEFGLLNGELILADEIHTLDSSRYWIAEGYSARLVKGEPQQMLDKQPVRQWLLSQGFKGEGKAPEFNDAKRVEIAKHYLGSYERISGREFKADVGPVAERIERALRKKVGG